jgi:hypothetical protein
MDHDHKVRKQERNLEGEFFCGQQIPKLAKLFSAFFILEWEIGLRCAQLMVSRYRLLRLLL